MGALDFRVLFRLQLGNGTFLTLNVVNDCNPHRHAVFIWAPECLRNCENGTLGNLKSVCVCACVIRTVLLAKGLIGGGVCF